jgi:hypothetical protein
MYYKGRNMNLRLLALSLIVVLLAACGDSGAPAEGFGTIAGKVSIGPLCPVEPCPGPTPDVYSSRSLLLRAKESPELQVPLSTDGTFSATVPAGVYEVTLSDCTFLGCQHALPRTVVVKAGEESLIDIEIDTGIR